MQAPGGLLQEFGGQALPGAPGSPVAGDHGPCGRGAQEIGGPSPQATILRQGSRVLKLQMWRGEVDIWSVRLMVSR